MGNIVFCELCNEKSNVKIGYKVISDTNYFLDSFSDPSKPERIQKVLKEHVNFGYRHRIISNGELHFYEQLCLKCYTINKEKINIPTPKDFELELKILPIGRYFHDGTGLP